MDSQILAAQKWLNATYENFSGWVPVPENGLTGWDTIYGLRRGLQAELSISPLASGFGPATTAAFVAQIGRIDASSTVSENVLRILSGALFCKGYPGFYEGEDPTFGTVSESIASVRGDLGLGTDPPFVDVKLMASLLSMDAYTIPFFGDGTSQVRDVQQWMNGEYTVRPDFAIVPCDGIFSRQVQTALLFALQYEFGMADGVANGNFGPGTRSGLRSQAAVGPGSQDGTHNFVRLFQAAMRFNRYDTDFNGQFGSDLESTTSEFQSFMEIPATGRGDYTTWCSLLVSSGDTSMRTTGFDTSKQLTPAIASAAQSAGYTHVGRYTVGPGKFITSDELSGLKAAGLRVFPLHQVYNNDASEMTHAEGLSQGMSAIERCRCLGIPGGSTVFFSVDFDPVGEVVDGPVADFFDGVNDAMNSVVNTSYRVGVYGTRNVCQTMTDDGKAEAAFVAGMSTGWSGNMGFPMPAQWNYNQIVETTQDFAGSTVPIDHVVVSRQARSVDLSGVVPPPTEKDGSDTATGFDVVFEWTVRAEVAIERHLKEVGTALDPLDSYSAFSGDYILDWLRKPRYDDAAYAGLWGKYLPPSDTTAEQIQARAAAQEALEAMTEDTDKNPGTTRDVMHFGATAAGYRKWGLPTDVTTYGLGDLGGWLLDLLQAYGTYRQVAGNSDVLTWMTKNVGSADSSGFGYGDVVADADAWLIVKAMQQHDDVLSDAMRDVFQSSTAARIGRFYSERFGGSEENVAVQFANLVDGIDVGPVKNFPVTTSLLSQAANDAPMPSQDEAALCGRAYARVLAQLSS